MEASTTSAPLGSTRVTRAVSVVVRVVDAAGGALSGKLVSPETARQVGQGTGSFGESRQGGDGVLGAGGALGLGGAGGHGRSLLRHHDGEHVVHLAGPQVARRDRPAASRAPDGAGRRRAAAAERAFASDT